VVGIASNNLSVYRTPQYKSPKKAMPDGKSEAISVRVSPDVKELLRDAAAHENRSQTNLLETLILDHGRKIGLIKTRRAKRTDSGEA
jgi:uncharacterized protein (DUF1778 family)